MLKNYFLPRRVAAMVLVLLVSLWTSLAHALPAFARQTGQSCASCHAGGQYPELTPYGRYFKMTGYTIGSGSLNAAVMGVAGSSTLKNLDALNKSLDTPVENARFDFETMSVFLAGKIADKMGAFVQFTSDNGFGQTASATIDNIDIRYADHKYDGSTDIIYGLSLNNNPSVADPWNTASAWMQYVPQSDYRGANAYTDNNTPYPSNGLAGPAAGLSAYAFIDRTLYAELGLYVSAVDALGFMQYSSGPDQKNYLRGVNPYWRLAYSKEWDAHNLMVGISGMNAENFDATNGNGDSGDSANYYRSKVNGLDMQYQYLMDPHTVTVQYVYQNQYLGQTPSAPLTTEASVDIQRAKMSYVYQSKYGASLAYFDTSDKSFTGNTMELFYLPLQNVRLGLQLTNYAALKSLTDVGGSASDANTVRFYVWAAY